MAYINFSEILPTEQRHFQSQLYCRADFVHDFFELLTQMVESLKNQLYMCYRVVWSHRMPYLYKSFSAKEPFNWLSCGKRLAT